MRAPAFELAPIADHGDAFALGVRQTGEQFRRELRADARGIAEHEPYARHRSYTLSTAQVSRDRKSVV